MYFLPFKPKKAPFHGISRHVRDFKGFKGSIVRITLGLYGNSQQEQENISLKRVVPENYEFGRIEIESPSGNPIRIYDLERTTQKRGSGVILTDYPEIMKELRESDMLRKLWEKYSRE